MSNNSPALLPKIKDLIRPHIALVVILLIFIILGTVYNISVPLFEAPDEMDHFRYVNWFATGNGLPHLTFDLQAVGHEVGQPPLYYAALAPFIATIDTQDWAQVAPPNTYWSRGAGINVHYHTAAERFPYRSTALAVHLARFITTLVACVTIASAYGLARIAIPKQAALAAALVAFNPQFIFVSSAINNDNLIAALSGLTLLLLARQLIPRRVPWWHYVLLGAVWGLTILAKLSGLALGVVLGLGLLLAVWHHRSWRPLILGGGGVAVGVAITAGWWFVRNWMLYGNPFAWEEMLAANLGLLRPELLSWSDTLFYATYLHRSFWAMFGYGIPAPAPFYQIVNGLVLVALIGVVLWWARTGWRQLDQPSTLAVLLMMAWSLIVFVSLLRWMRQVDASNQGRLYFPAISSLAVLLALGSSAFGGRRNWLGLVMATFLLVWAVLSPFLIIQPAYAQPEPLSTDANIPNPVSVRFGEEIDLLGYGLPQSSVQPEGSLPVELYWQAVVPMSESYVVALHALDPSGQVVGGLDMIPFQARYPTPAWQPGQPFRDSYLLPIEGGAVPGRAELLLDVYPWGRPEEGLPALAGGTPVEGGLRLATFKIAPVETTTYSPTYEVDAVLGQVARLMGFDAPPAIRAGQPFTVTLYWEALTPDGHDYTVFVHVVNSAGTTVAQADSPPQSNGYPTSLWAAGEQVRDPHKGLPAEGVPAGQYQIMVGLYDLDTGQRLPAHDAGGGRLPNDSVPLGIVEFVDSP